MPDAAERDQQDRPPRGRLFSSVRTVAALTLASRVLGMARDAGMAALFGNGTVLDAFTVAFRVPNLFRRLFGEGALTTAFLPLFVRERERHGRQAAWRLANGVFVRLGLLLVGVVAACELAVWLAVRLTAPPSGTRLLAELTAILLPYLLLVCLAAQAAAVMHAERHFVWPALLPVVLNVVWLTAIAVAATQLESAHARIRFVCTSVLVAGVLQLLLPLPTLIRLGLPFELDWRGTADRVREIARMMGPVVLGLSLVQLNTLADSLIAWSFSRPDGAAPDGAYPLETGTAAALYLGQRMYQFPLGIFGVALGTVLFPLLSEHAERGRFDLLRHDLVLGLRLVLVIGLPASLGLVLLSEPITELLFRHGAFDATDARQTSSAIAAYGIAVWAYSALQIVTRGFYALGNRTAPVRVGVLAVATNLALDFALMYPFGGTGLALATALTAMLQTVLLVALAQREVGRLDWERLLRVALRATVATAVMGLCCLALLRVISAGDTIGLRLLRVFGPLLGAVAVYFAAAALLGLDEAWLLFRRETRDDTDR